MKKTGISSLAFLIAFVVFLIVGFTAQVGSMSAFKWLFSKLPLANQVVESEYRSRLYGLTQEEKAVLTTAYYNVDFLMSVRTKDKTFLAIYPYTVEFGFDLTDIKTSKHDSITSVSVSAPKVTNSKLDDQLGVIKIRDAAVEPELLTMMKTAFRNRSVDFAYEANIVETAQKNIQEYIQGLFQEDTFVFKFEMPNNTFKNVSSNKTPINFVYRDTALMVVSNFSQHFGSAQNDKSEVCFNPTDMIIETKAHQKINLYYNYGTSKNISQVNELVNQMVAGLSDDDYCIKYYDPIKPEEKKIVSFFNATNGNGNRIYFTVDDIQYCMVMNDRFEAENLRKAGSDLMYLAMASQKQGNMDNLQYEAYLKCYDSILCDIKEQNISAAKNKFGNLLNLKMMNGERGPNDAEKDLYSFISPEFNESSDDVLNLMVQARKIFSNNDTLQMTPDFQKKVIANYKQMGITDKTLLNIIEYFYTLPQTTESDKELYRNDLVSKGIYSDKVAQSLSSINFCKYACMLLQKNDDSVIVQDNNHFEAITIIGREEVNSIKEYSRDTIINFMKKYSLIKPNEGQLVWCLKPNGTVETDYPLVIFEKDSIIVTPDYDEWDWWGWSSPSIYKALYSDVKLGKDSTKDGVKYLFTIGKYVGNEKAIYDAIKEIRERKNQYVPYDKWSESIKKTLQSKIENRYSRPVSLL
ncbi:MAG: DUF4230 domain-containing protein [Bacteroidales bacterium]|nr:DUF4230 domain-containing protein [Bacteroidales bacterium]